MSIGECGGGSVETREAYSISVRFYHASDVHLNNATGPHAKIRPTSPSVFYSMWIYGSTNLMSTSINWLTLGVM